MKYFLMVLLSVFFFVLTYKSAPTEFTPFDLSIIICLFSGVFGIQILAARLSARYRTVQNLILAGFTTINILAVNLILNEAFLSLPNYGAFLLLILAIFILFTFMTIVDENTRIAKIILGIFSFATTWILVKTLLSIAPTPVPEEFAENGMTSAKNIRLVTFKKKPNVYLIGFDSIIPKVLLKKHMGLNTTPYHEVFDAHFRRFKNFFADRIPTQKSLNSLLALDIEYYSELVRAESQYKSQNYLFTGVTPSPLFEIFKYNGYETNTLYDGWYFGRDKGPHVDNYLANEARKSGVCDFIENKLRAVTFFGYCFFVHSEKSRSVMNATSSLGRLTYIDFLIQSMRAGVHKASPQIFLTYIYSPGHTNKTFNNESRGALDEYSQAYLNASKNTAAYLNEIVSFIAEEDSDAIVYVFGDHGPIISRKNSVEDNSDFFIQDRFGVYGGIHPPERCSESFSQPYTKAFMTVSQGVHMIIRCLSGGENAFLKLNDYRLPNLESNTQYRYEDHLYE